MVSILQPALQPRPHSVGPPAVPGPGGPGRLAGGPPGALARGEIRCSAKRVQAIIDAESTADLWDCNGMTISHFLELVARSPLEMTVFRLKTLGNLGGLAMVSSRLRECVVTRTTAVLEV